jgi:hypothetical protein
VTTGRDIVLLNGVPRSVDCRVVIFYAHPVWMPGPTLFDLLPRGQEALAAWLHDGSGGTAGAPARAVGAPLFVVWNGTYHFDSVEPASTARGDAIMQEAGRPKIAGARPTALKVLPPSTAVASLPPALLLAAASAAHAAASAHREVGETINAQREAAIVACRFTAAASGHASPSMPCFMFGSTFLSMPHHWASRCKQSTGILMGSPCALAWGSPGGLPLAARFAGGAAAAGGSAQPNPDSPPKPPTTAKPGPLPWGYAASILTDGVIHHLPPSESIADIPFGARAKCSKAFGLILKRGAATPHDVAAAAAYHLFSRWVLCRDCWHAAALKAGTKRPRAPEPCQYDTISKRAQAFLDGRWEDLHAAYMATVSDASASSAVIARNNFELKRQESACAKVSEGACSKGMAALLDKGTVEPDGDVAKSVLVPLHPITGALTPAQSAQLASWLLKVAGSAYEATPEAMTHALTTAAKASAPGPSGFRTSHLRRMLLEDDKQTKLSPPGPMGRSAPARFRRNFAKRGAPPAPSPCPSWLAGSAPSPWATPCAA